MGNSESKAKSLHAQGIYGTGEFVKSGKLREINLSVRLLRQAVEAAPPDDPMRPRYLMNRGNWGGFLYERGGGAAAFTESVEAYEEAIALAGSSHKDRPIILITFGDLLMKRHNREKTDIDLERAERLYDEAVRLTSPGHEYRITSLISLGSCLISKFEKTKDLKDIDKAIKGCEDGIADISPSDGSIVWAYSVLSGCHLAKYETTKAPADLEEAFKVARKAVQCNPEHSDALSALTRCHNARFKQTQSLKDIDAAIGEAKKAVDVSNGISLQWEECLILWADQYDAKYAKTLKVGDLSLSIKCREGLVDTLCVADPARTHSLYLLCDFLFKKYRIVKDGKLLLEAISMGEHGLSAVWPWPGNPERTALYDLLASCYGAKLSRVDLAKSKAKKDLERAISLSEEALKMMAPDDPRREETAKKLRALKVDGAYEGPKQ